MTASDCAWLLLYAFAWVGFVALSSWWLDGKIERMRRRK